MTKILLMLTLIFLSACSRTANKEQNTMENSQQMSEQTQKRLAKSDAEWKASLTPEQYRILRRAGTERPNGKIYAEFNAQGAGKYYCVGCGSELFSSQEKFESHCGWPSFFDVANKENITTKTDYLLGYPRTEVNCANCGGHLGHVFEGEGFDTPTDRRYCINGTILAFQPADADKE